MVVVLLLAVDESIDRGNEVSDDGDCFCFCARASETERDSDGVDRRVLTASRLSPRLEVRVNTMLCRARAAILALRFFKGFLLLLLVGGMLDRGRTEELVLGRVNVGLSLEKAIR